MKHIHKLLSATSLCGDNVKNAKGEDLGRIKDMMIDTATGQVQYYVLSFGGLWGLGDKLFAIPPQAFSVDTKNKCMFLNVEKERLKTATGFDQDKWPDMADEAFRTEVYSHYGYEYRKAA